MFRFWSICIALILGSVCVHGQVTVSAGFSQDTILIGNTVKYTVTIRANSNINIHQIEKNQIDSIFSAVQTSKIVAQDSTAKPDPVISDYTILDNGKWDDKDENGIYDKEEMSFDITNVGNEVLYENTYTIQFWDPGPQIIRHPSLVFQSGDSLYQYPPSGTAQVFIAPPFDEAELQSDSLDIAPIIPIIREPKNISDYFVYMYIALALIGLFLFGLLIKWMNKPKEVEEVVVEIIRPAHEIALEKLHDLGDKQIWQQGQVKEYQSNLTHIIREYLENRYDIKALESTTDDIVQELNNKDFDPTDESTLREILQVADLVKFAKAKPDMSIHERFLDSAKSFVRKTKDSIIEQPTTDA